MYALDMKYLGISLLILGFIGITVFGFLLMGHDEMGHNKCAAVSARGLICPLATNFASFLFHVSILKNLILAMTQSATLALLAAALAYLLTRLDFSLGNIFRIGVLKSAQIEENYGRELPQFRRWLVLTLKRDPALTF